MMNDRFTRWRQPPGVGIVVLALICLTASIGRPAEQATQPTRKMSPRDALEAQFPAWSEPKKIIRVAGASHFFDKQLAELGKAVLEGMAGG